MLNKKSIIVDTNTPTLIEEKDLYLLLDKLYHDKGYDFRDYKKSSITRRIARRLQIYKVSFQEYLNLLNSDPEEYDRLFSYLTIKTSEFFRDPEVFDTIQKVVLPEIFLQRYGYSGTLQERNKTHMLHSNTKDNENNPPSPPFSKGGMGGFSGEKYRDIRVWCCGCAQGEEAYSIGILFMEHIEKSMSNRLGLRIFATDIDEHTIEIGRKGIYGVESIKNLDPYLLERYFNSMDGNYKITPFLRNLVRFGVHDIVQDFPIAYQDLILCRNVLIYFNKDLQEKVFEKLYYALRPGGFLVLGKAEVPPTLLRKELREVAKKEKIYQKTTSGGLLRWTMNM